MSKDTIPGEVRNTQQSSDMVERVARALFALDAPKGDPDELVFHPHSDLQTPKWKLYERQAQVALRASHHAELVEALGSALEMVLEATQSGNFSTEEFNRCNALLAKIGGAS